MNNIPKCELTPNERTLLDLLQRRKGKTVSYEQIERAGISFVSGRAYTGILIREIRRKRQDVQIACVQGKGYTYIGGMQECKPRQKIYKRGTKDMPKCSVPGCRNHLYWNCERGWGICIKHHNLERRRNAPRNMPTIPSASFAEG